MTFTAFRLIYLFTLSRSDIKYRLNNYYFTSLKTGMRQQGG